MVTKDARILALAGGRAADSTPANRAPQRAPKAGIVARLSSAMCWLGRAGVPAHSPLIMNAAQDDAPTVYEKHFANESDALEYARAMTARGYLAHAQYEVYDYSWSVEVHAAATESGGTAEH